MGGRQRIGGHRKEVVNPFLVFGSSLITSPHRTDSNDAPCFMMRLLVQVAIKVIMITFFPLPFKRMT